MTEEQVTGEQVTGERIFHEVKTLDQAKEYMTRLVIEVEDTRRIVDDLEAISRDGGLIPKQSLRKAYRSLMIRYGRALGALTTLMHVRILTDEAYTLLNQRINLSIMPKVVQ
jgi:hypothetical protein